jgi:uncharacterized repeat protein (TIGR03847 family)
VGLSFELDACDRITAGAVGEPGHRTFFIQARSGAQLVTVQAEKQQVQVLAATLKNLLESLPDADEEESPEAIDLQLEEPLIPEWRAGSMTLEYDQEADRIAIVIQEALPEESEGSPGSARFKATRAQIRAMSEHALTVVSAGRPSCQLCGFPIDPEGHACPALNGHRELA